MAAPAATRQRSNAQHSTVQHSTVQRALVERCAPDGAPQQYRVGGRHYVVTEVHGHWVTGTPWWLTGQDVDTHTWRVTVAADSPRDSRGSGRVVELRATGTHWQLTRVGGAR